MTPEALRNLIVEALEEKKGRDVVTMDVAAISDVTDYMIVVSGTSNRHVKALVDEVVEAAANAGVVPLGVEGRDTNEWVLVDMGDALVHVMQTETRDFYDLERLWSELPAEGRPARAGDRRSPEASV
ncbi:MAG TPA: ribosome silencing factor [Pseudomonadales bacterium]